ncbi:MAG: tetratricopeptide repeat protein, partial [Candidatus Sericytochromatia bacterium]|nr:tetratricopeptide repeat protein [Candidatus Sericytochromatia bacterium]
MPKRLVSRARLLDPLTQIDGPFGLTVLAPAGYGKATLVRHFLSRQDLPFAWWQVPTAAGDAATLAASLTAALTASGRLADTASTAMTAGAGDPGAVVDRLIGRLAETEPAWLIIEDVHLLDGLPTADLVAELISSLLESWRPVLIGRWLPAALRRLTEVPAARLPWQRLLPAHLRLGADHLGTVCQAVTGRDLPLAEAAMLAGASDGSMLGLLIALQAMAPTWTVDDLQTALLRARDDLTGLLAVALQRMPEADAKAVLVLGLVGDWQPTFGSGLEAGMADKVRRLSETCGFWLRRPDGGGAWHPVVAAAPRHLAADRTAHLPGPAGDVVPADLPLPVQLHVAAVTAGDWRPLLRRLIVESLPIHDMSGLLIVQRLVPPACQADPWAVGLQAEIYRMSRQLRETLALVETLPATGDVELLAFWRLIRAAAGIAAGLAPGADVTQVLVDLPSGPSWLRARALTLQGVHQFIGLGLDAARANFDAALAMCRQVGDVVGETRALTNLGAVCTARSRYGEARTWLEQALDVTAAARQVPSVHIYVALGECLLAMGAYRDGLQRVDEGLALACTLGLRTAEANLYWVRAQLLTQVHDLEQAAADAASALALGDQLGDRIASWRGLACLAEIACARSDLHQAAEWAAELRQRAGATLGEPRYIFAQYVQAQVALASGAWQEALCWLEPIIVRLRQVADVPHAMAKAL